MKLFVSFAVAALSVVTFGQTVTQGTLTTFNSLAGAKLGAPSTYLKAIDFTNVNRTTTVNGINFTSSDFTSNFSPVGSLFAPPLSSPNYGAGADAANFKTIMEDIRWTNTSTGVGGTFSGLSSGNYVLKMYFFENYYPNGAPRRFNIQVDNTTVVTDFTPLGGANNVSYVYELPITIGAQNSFSARATQGNFGSDPYPILSAMTLQTAVPEPATMAALGLGIVGLVKRRRK